MSGEPEQAYEKERERRRLDLELQKAAGLRNANSTAADAMSVQHGGAHYKNMAIQPAEYCSVNDIGFLPGSGIKYLSRYRDKNGLEDIKKAKHFCEMIARLEYGVEI